MDLLIHYQQEIYLIIIKNSDIINWLINNNKKINKD